LARRSELEAGAAVLAAQLARCQESNGRLRLQLDQLRGRLTAAKGQMGVLIARQRSADAQRQFAKAQPLSRQDLEAFDSFDELSRRVAEAEAEAEALAELQSAHATDVLPKPDIERELQLLKAECAVSRE
jgi:phage shock protein A